MSTFLSLVLLLRYSTEANWMDDLFENISRLENKGNNLNYTAYNIEKQDEQNYYIK